MVTSKLINVIGFWGNVLDEAGKKTGKAIGNKVFGKYAADDVVRIHTNVNGSVNNCSSQPEKRSLTSSVISQIDNEEYQKRKTEKFQHDLKVGDEILNIEFDTSDFKGNIQVLLKLMTMTDAWVKNTKGNEDKENMYKLARSKFDAGVMMCQMIDPTNPSLIMFQNKQKEWDSIEKKNTMIPIIICFCLLLPLIIWIIGYCAYWW